VTLFWVCWLKLGVYIQREESKSRSPMDIGGSSNAQFHMQSSRHSCVTRGSFSKISKKTGYNVNLLSY